MNSSVVSEFFARDVMARGGFILSADTMNFSHIGPKLLPFVKAMNPTEYHKWLSIWGDYFWGTDSNADAEACSWLYEVLESCTYWAHSNVPGMVTDEQVYEFGFSEYDGALLGWWAYPVEY